MTVRTPTRFWRKYGKQAVADAVARAVPVEDERFKKLSEIQRKDLTEVPIMSTGLPELDAVIGGFYFGQLIVLDRRARKR